MLKEYLESIKDITPESNELIHRAFLQKLLTSLKDDFNTEFKIEHEPNRDKQGGQPDFRISYQGLNIGYIENKRVGTDLNQLLKSDQVLKYLELNPNLMLTDYLNFMWVGKDENNAPLIKKEISIASLDELSKPLKAQTERDLIELFKSFFNHEAAPITNAKDFATHLSPRTRYLKDALIKYQKGNDSQALMQEILQNPPPPPFKPSGVKYRKTEQDTGSLEFSNGNQYTNRVLLHNLWGNNAFIPNLALVCDRGSKVSPISNVFVTSKLCDLHLNGSGSYAFLLYRLT
ncbi:hypothetical protein ID0623_01580 [Helicobacter pylori]